MPAKLPVEEKKRRTKERKRQYYLENRDKVLMAATLYYQNNKRTILEKQRSEGKWKHEEYKDKKRIWWSENKHKFAEKRAQYYATVLQQKMKDQYVLNKSNPLMAGKREKKKAYLKSYYNDNKTRLLGDGRSKMARSPEKREARRIRSKEFYRKNKKHCIAIHSKWRKLHKECDLAQSHRRRMRMKGLLHPASNSVAIRGLFSLAKKRHSETGIKHHVDHVIPVRCGGWHHEDNLQVLPMPINLTKQGDPFWVMDGYKSWRDVPRHLWPEGLKDKYSEILSTESLKSA